MKNNFEELRLLDAALADESWESCHARLRSEGCPLTKMTKVMPCRMSK